ncbi:pilus assembly protein [Zoogloea sp.]|uniref:pilus assembly protein n=1 Tax=Zoogloea sp. TaxID=49181 RepID=UPI0035AF15F4
MNAATAGSKASFPRWKFMAARFLVAAGAWHSMLPVVHATETALADVPITASTEAVPANVMLALSVEFPTAQSHANFSTGVYGVTALPASSQSDPYFEPTRKYLGYFDPTRCYAYTGTSTDGYFYPTDSVQGANYTCSGEWSGNYMNWATMHVIDLFRWAMTGGARDKDEPADFSAGTPVGVTILKKAWSNNQGSKSNFPDKSLAPTNVSKYTPLSTSGSKNLIATVFDKGINVEFTQSNNNSAAGSVIGSYQVRVLVCGGTDITKHEYADQSYCQKYENPEKTKRVYKPVGLIQKNIQRMRFGATAYHNLNGDTYGSDTLLKAWDGGVLKAQIRDTRDEILETGAFLQDPFPVDRGGDSEITRSGAINYLNLFGYKAKSYKRYDNVSEMYAVALRYLLGPSGIGHVPSYSAIPSGVTAAQRVKIKDDFPIITNWLDPVLPASQGGSCQKQFIIGIGDTNTCGDTCDNNLSGSGYPMDSLVAGERFAGETVKDWTKKITGYSLAVDYIAGMAYAANTAPLRSDFPDSRIKTFWVDALEYSTMANNNQYYKAAKYGGFTDKDKDGVPDAGEWDALAQNYKGTPIPDTYFPASDPDRLVSGLNSAFSQINSLIGSASGVGTTGSVISDSLAADGFFQTTYNSLYWSGDLKGLKIDSINVTSGEINTSQVWSAATKLDLMVTGSGWDSARKVVTLAPDSNGKLKGVPFRLANLSAAQAAALGSSTEQSNVLKYLRGDTTNQSTLNVRKTYRYRASVLGDIVDSGALYVGPPNEYYSDAYNPGYSIFKTSKASRKPVVYVGANDGMFHAFDAQMTTSGGAELFAVVPNAAYLGPDGKPGESGLRALSDNAYLHHYYVNATAYSRDVDFKRAGGTIESNPNSYDWRTLLVFGLGKGGRSYVALDITDTPTSSTTEATIANKVLWEFTHEDMGFSYGRANIVKTRKWGWVVIISGGYNNILGTTNTSVPGKGVLFVLDPKSGTVLQKIYTNEGSVANPAGMAHQSGYVQDYTDMTIDFMYAGDLLGNLWRFDFSSPTNDVPNPTSPILHLRDSLGNPQPVTTEPRVDPGTDLVRYVFVGTGRLLHTNDRNNTQQQTFYALRDGTVSDPYSSAANAANPLPSGITFPVQRNNMVQVDSLIEGVVRDSSKPMGWFYDLTGRRGTLAEQVVQHPQVNEGVVSWIGTLMNQDKCNPGGESAAYAVKYGSAKSTFATIVNNVRVPIAFVSSTSGLVGAKMVRYGSSIRLLGSYGNASSPGFVGSQVGGFGDPRVLNWRIIGQ